MSNQIGNKGPRFFDEAKLPPVGEVLVHVDVTGPLTEQIAHIQKMENAQKARSPEQPPVNIIAGKELLIEHLKDINQIVAGNIPAKYMDDAPTAPSQSAAPTPF